MWSTRTSCLLMVAFFSAIAGKATATDLIYKCAMSDRQSWIGGGLYDSLLSDPPHGLFNINLKSAEYTVISRKSGEVIGSSLWEPIVEQLKGKSGNEYLFVDPETNSALRINQRVSATTFVMMDSKAVYAGECSLAFGEE